MSACEHPDELRLAARADGVPLLWRTAALDPPRVHGEPLFSGTARFAPEDFVVAEELGFPPDGAGPHFLLRVRKRSANTEWVAAALARAAGVRSSEIGFAGRKDRHAIATQWFSVPAGSRDADFWRKLRNPEFDVLEAHPHRRKLKRGALRGNRFRVRIRALNGNAAALEERAAAIRREGVPNYFGPQRFGRAGSNLRAAWQCSAQSATLPTRSRTARSFVLSAARSVLFNAVLAERVRQGSWNVLESGDVANLDGSGSIFRVLEVTEDLPARLASLDLHPTGPLWGAGERGTGGRIDALERDIAEQFAPLARLLAEAGLRQERRALRLRVAEFQAAVEDEALVVAFELPAGAFATTVLRELVETRRGPIDAPD